MNKNFHKIVVVSGIFVILSFLPGCMDMFKSGSADVPMEESKPSNDEPVLTGQVLMTIKGKPAITTDSLAVEKEDYLKSMPQLVEAMKHIDPKEFDHYLLEGLVGQYIADEYVTSNKIDQTPAYQAELKKLYRNMDRTLNAIYFNKQISVTVPDSEVKSFYEVNKNKIQGVVISHGGVAAQGIEFANLAEARAFVSQVKSAQNNFTKVAQEDGLTDKIKDFKLVNAYSIGIDEQLRDKIVAIKTVPAVELIEVNDKFWVVFATAKEESKYVPYEQIKDRLKQQLEQMKRSELLEKKINELRQEYAVTVNEDYFKPEAEQKSAPTVGGGLAHEAHVQESVSKRLA